MSISIGKFIAQKLRSKGIFNKDAAKFIGLSESAFEKVLTQNDIHGSRLIKLSQLLNINLFEYYNDQEPLKTILANNLQELQSKIDILNAKIADQAEIISNQNDVIRLLKEKVEYLAKD